MTKSESIAELAGALAKAQGEIKGASKDKANPFFKSKYADLASVWDACREPLSKNGLSVVQLPTFSEGSVSVETCLLHSSGQWISTILSSPVAKTDAQSVGSATTYLRRYSLSSICGVAPEDDDGNAATGKESPAAQRSADPEPNPAAAPQNASGGTAAVSEAKSFSVTAQEIADAASAGDLAVIQAQLPKITVTEGQRKVLAAQIKRKLEAIG